MKQYLVASILFLGFCLPQPGEAADSSTQLWNKVCGKDAGGGQICAVEQFAMVMPQKMVVLRAAFFRTNKPDQMKLNLTAPLGILLPPGLSLSVDGSQPITLPFERCSQGGCDASAVLDKTALAKFEKGKLLAVRYTPTEKGAVEFPIKLDGLSGALKLLSE